MYMCMRMHMCMCMCMYMCRVQICGEGEGFWRGGDRGGQRQDVKGSGEWHRDQGEVYSHLRELTDLTTLAFRHLQHSEALLVYWS